MDPRVTSEGSDTEPDMEETRATGRIHPLTEFQIIMQKMKQMERQAEIARKKLQTLKKIVRVKAILGQS